MKILVVDDQRSARRILTDILSAVAGVKIHEASSLKEALAALELQSFDVALLDIRLDTESTNRDGLVLVREIRARFSCVPVVVTGSQEMAEIREAMRSGAYDYILKDDLCAELVVPIIEGLRDRERLEREVLHLRARSAAADAVPGLVGQSRAMEALRSAIRKVAVSDRPALVLGPTGAGKELVVQSLHALGPSPEEPLMDLNCGAIPEALMEAQLFGHERGAFTGAEKKGQGFFSAVGRGTLFLDEIAELPLALQAKLLRVLETGRFRPVGTTEEATFAGRVVAATHVDLEKRVREHRFREDLYYRLNVLALRVPALDERREDIPDLVSHFTRKQGRPLSFTEGAMALIQGASWPGNVRQLRNLVDRVAVFAESDLVDDEVLRPFLPTGTEEGRNLEDLARALLRLPVPDKLEAIERALVNEAMSLSNGNKSAAARLLGVHRKAVERRVEQPDPSRQDEVA